MDDLASPVPLAPAALHILLSLASEERHGYSILQEAARQHFKLGPATLYGNLEKLLAAGWIEETARTEGDERRRYYRLTPLGRSVLKAEVKRLEDVVRIAKVSFGRAAKGRAS